MCQTVQSQLSQTRYGAKDGRKAKTKHIAGAAAKDDRDRQRHGARDAPGQSARRQGTVTGKRNEREHNAEGLSMAAGPAVDGRRLDRCPGMCGTDRLWTSRLRPE